MMMSHPSPIPEYQYDDSQTFDIQSTDPSFQTRIESWQQLMGEEPYYHQRSDSSSSQDQTGTFPFQPVTEELDPQIDYETIIRSKNLFYDPSPKVIRKSSTDNSMVYTQNVMIRFLQPPPVEQGPLIIREVRPPQPPPPPPLIVRQRPPPPLSPPPIILREKPPPLPPILTAKTVTRTLPPLPPPPRSVIIEKLPALPPKPRDIIIERWLPYETKEKRKVLVQRAEEAKSYPPPRNVIITYEPVQVRVVRQIERLGVKIEDPKNYQATYQTSLLDTQQLLDQVKQLGITEDLSLPSTLTTTTTTNYDNHAQDFRLSDDDLPNQFAQYGVTLDSIPY